jgi:hypothetical protein
LQSSIKFLQVLQRISRGRKLVRFFNCKEETRKPKASSIVHKYRNVKTEEISKLVAIFADVEFYIHKLNAFEFNSRNDHFDATDADFVEHIDKQA